MNHLFVVTFPKQYDAFPFGLHRKNTHNIQLSLLYRMVKFFAIDFGEKSTAFPISGQTKGGKGALTFEKPVKMSRCFSLQIKGKGGKGLETRRIFAWNDGWLGCRRRHWRRGDAEAETGQIKRNCQPDGESSG
ncbi:MAG: hypothetical protein ACOX0U_06210 [Oscillospiraceae bacterium]|jgi:hypothetical protein